MRQRPRPRAWSRKSRMHWSGSPADVAQIQTADYKVIAAKWEEHEWSEDGGGIAWKCWASIYIQPTGQDAPLKRVRAPTISTRDQHNADYDRRDLWGYNNVSVKDLGNNKVEVAWADNKGNLGPTYTYDLNEEYNKKDEKKN